MCTKVDLKTAWTKTTITIITIFLERRCNRANTVCQAIFRGKNESNSFCAERKNFRQKCWNIQQEYLQCNNQRYSTMTSKSLVKYTWLRRQNYLQSSSNSIGLSFDLMLWSNTQQSVSVST